MPPEFLPGSSLLRQATCLVAIILEGPLMSDIRQRWDSTRTFFLIYSSLLARESKDGGCHGLRSARGPLTLSLSHEGRGNLLPKGKVEYVLRLLPCLRLQVH